MRKGGSYDPPVFSIRVVQRDFARDMEISADKEADFFTNEG